MFWIKLFIGLVASWFVVGCWEFVAIFLLSGQTRSPSGELLLNFEDKWWGIFWYAVLPMSAIGVLIFSGIVACVLAGLRRHDVGAAAAVSGVLAIFAVALLGQLAGGLESSYSYLVEFGKLSLLASATAISATLAFYGVLRLTRAWVTRAEPH